MKKIKIAITLFIFFMLLPGLYGCVKGETYTVPNAFITIDINPSIEILTGDDGLVSEVNALNEDAEILLYGTDFTGKSAEEVAEAIIQLGIELGYLDSELENAIIITAEADNNDETSELELRLERRIQRFIARKRIKLEIIKARQAASEDMLQQAEELGISVGKLKLIAIAMSLDEELTLEAAAEMSVRDLTAIVKAARKEIKLYKDELKDSFFALKEELKIRFFQEKVQLINNFIQETEATVFENFVNEAADIDTIKATYEKYALEVLAFKPTEEEIPTNLEELLNRLEQLQNKLRELLDKKHDIINSLDKEKFIEIREQLKQIKNEIKEARPIVKGVKLGHFRFVCSGYIFENKARFINFRELMKIRHNYVLEFETLGIDLDELEDFVLEQISKAIVALKDSLNEEFQEKIEDLRAQAENFKDYLQKENILLREANKMKQQNNKRKGRD